MISLAFLKDPCCWSGRGLNQQQQQLYSLYKNTKVGWFAPQIAGKLVVADRQTGALPPELTAQHILTKVGKSE